MAHHFPARTCMHGLAFLVLAFPALPRSTTAQTNACDPGLPVVHGNPLRYQQRGDARQGTDRCEGVYVREVGATPLLVASFTAAFPNYDLNSEAPLVVTWPAVGDAAVRLRAYPLRQKVYFRMDTERPAGSTSYRWPIAVLAALRLSRADLGVLGWTRRTVGDAERDVYLPLGVTQGPALKSSGNYELVVLPGRELTEVYVSIARVGADGVPTSYVQEDLPLERGYYPAGRGIVVPIRGMRDPGLYYVELGATLRGGGSTTAGIWFFHAGT